MNEKSQRTSTSFSRVAVVHLDLVGSTLVAADSIPVEDVAEEGHTVRPLDCLVRHHLPWP